MKRRILLLRMQVQMMDFDGDLMILAKMMNSRVHFQMDSEEMVLIIHP